MPRRVSLPGASELFRPTPAAAEAPGDAAVDQTPEVVRQAPAPARATGPSEQAAASGRVRHDEKITVYVSTDELIALEQGRLQLRRDFSLAFDRGRMVRESVAIVMADLAEHGENSELVRRLQSQ